jgi:hypothetical protein
LTICLYDMGTLTLKVPDNPPIVEWAN